MSLYDPNVANRAQTGGIFQFAVDPIALGIPQYFDIIPRENARDLSLIKSKLDGDMYGSLDAFEQDFQLMLKNALTFNPPGTAVHEATRDCMFLALQLCRSLLTACVDEESFEKAMKSLRMQISAPKGTKRGSSLGNANGASKKQRVL